MKFQLFMPTQEQIDSANERGVDLLGELKKFYKESFEYYIKDFYQDKNVEKRYVEIECDVEQILSLTNLGFDIAAHIVEQYSLETIKQIDENKIKNAIEVINIDDINRICDILDNTEYKEVVIGAGVIEYITNSDNFIANENVEDTRVFYKIGKYKDIIIKVNPYMKFNDFNIYFIE